MTPDKTPTEAPSDAQLIAELEAAGVAFIAFRGGLSGTKDIWTTSGSQDARKIAAGVRAILAKWGSPVVAGEPVAWMARLPSGSEVFARTRDFYPDAVPVFTTPQPTQAQAGAVPLTVDEIEQLIAQWSYELHGDRARYLVRMTEKHHGIKEGGQHG